MNWKLKKKTINEKVGQTNVYHCYAGLVYYDITITNIMNLTKPFVLCEKKMYIELSVLCFLSSLEFTIK